MRNHFRRKYIKVRKEMKSELRIMMKDNMTLMLLVRDIVLLHKAKRLEHEIWYVIGTKYHDIYKKEFCDGGLVGKSMCGRHDEFFNTMYFIDKVFCVKFMRLIPDRLALGDAYAVAISFWRKNKLTN